MSMEMDLQAALHSEHKGLRFSIHLFHTIMVATPENLEKIRKVFPAHVMCFEHYQKTGQLKAFMIGGEVEGDQ